MEVGIRYGVCNNLPAESISPENGWHQSSWPIPNHEYQYLASAKKIDLLIKKDIHEQEDALIAQKYTRESIFAAINGADLGGSSKYSNENFED